MALDPASNRGLTALTSLRRFVQPGIVQERCALCGADVAEDHPHLVEPATRRLVCACRACALLFSGPGEARFCLVPRGVRKLAEVRISDEVWYGLNLPINLAFFLESTPAGGVVALYPSPAGATESPVASGAWEALMVENPTLRGLEPDVEGLLVNRVGEARDCYRVGLDDCFRLVGLIRLHWRGLSGGSAAWEEIGRFFDDLNGRSDHA